MQNYTGIALKLFGYNLWDYRVIKSHLQGFRHPGFLCYYNQDQEPQEEL